MEWERLPTEPARAYRAFSVFLNMPQPRSSYGAAKLAVRKPRKTAEQRRGDNNRYPAWERWKKDFRWDERALAFDQHNAQVAQKALDKQTEAQVVDWAKRRTEAWEQDYQDYRVCIEKIRAMLALVDPRTADPQTMRNLVAGLNGAIGGVHTSIDSALPPDDFDPDSLKDKSIEELRELQARLSRRRAKPPAQEGP